MFGRPAGEVLGQNVACLMPEPYASEHDHYLERYLRTGERRIIGIGREVLGARADGTSFPMELAVCEVELAGARHFAGFVRDVSERREAERRLNDLQREFLQVSRLSAMGEMASALAHELNQPLTAVANYAQAARRLGAAEEPDWERIQSLLERTVQQAARAGEIMHRMREFLAKGDTERRPEDGSFGLIGRARFPFTAEAMTSATLSRHSRRQLEVVVASDPEAAAGLMDLACLELERSQGQMLLLGRKSAEEKIASFLLAYAARSAGAPADDQTIRLPMSREDMADYLGLTIETVSRTFGRLKRKGLTALLTPQHVALLRVEELECLADAR